MASGDRGPACVIAEKYDYALGDDRQMKPSAKK